MLYSSTKEKNYINISTALFQTTCLYKFVFIYFPPTAQSLHIKTEKKGKRTGIKSEEILYYIQAFVFSDYIRENEY